MAQDEQQSRNTQDQRIQTSIQKALELATRCSASETSDNYEFLEEQVDQLEAQARDAFQSRTNFGPLLSKLDAAKSLSADDLKALELLIVGDAEYYLRYESEVEEWKTQLKRVLDRIAGLQTSAPDVDTLMHVRALCREAHEVLADLVFYYDSKERAAKFQAATQGPIDAEGYHFLAGIVRQMLASDKM